EDSLWSFVVAVVWIWRKIWIWVRVFLVPLPPLSVLLRVGESSRLVEGVVIFPSLVRSRSFWCMFDGLWRVLVAPSPNQARYCLCGCSLSQVKFYLRKLQFKMYPQVVLDSLILKSMITGYAVNLPGSSLVITAGFDFVASGVLFWLYA
ncbi:unnamed protein product, partial [Brassica rapa subsp. narinosa]